MAAAPCPAALCRLRTRLTRSGTLRPPIMTLTLIRPLKLIEHSFLLRSSLLLKNQLRRTCRARAHAVPVALCRAVRHRFACSCFIYCDSFIPPLPPVASCKRAKAQWNRALRGLRLSEFPRTGRANQHPRPRLSIAVCASSQQVSRCTGWRRNERDPKHTRTVPVA